MHRIFLQFFFNFSSSSAFLNNAQILKKKVRQLFVFDLLVIMQIKDAAIHFHSFLEEERE